MENTEISESKFKNGMNVLYLANCALRDVEPQTSIVKAMDLAKVYAMAQKQSMLAVAYFGLEKWLKNEERHSSEMDADLMVKWQQARDMAIRKNTMLDIAREQILAYFEEHGIWYMPLKGTILKDMYPKVGMRQMADNDILIDATCRKQVYDYIVSLGYKGSYHEHGAHDEFIKKPFYNFEIHNVLVSQSDFPKFGAYYRDVKEKLIKLDGHKYCFRDEDFYIYLMVHAYKHHSGAGNGVRHIMDIHVFLEKKPKLDWEYIHKELTCLGILQYATTVKRVAQKLFTEKVSFPQEIELSLTPDEQELLAFSIGAGTYGKAEIRVEKNLEEFSKGKQLSFLLKVQFLWKRLVSEAGLYSDFPRMAKYKILHPFLYVARAVKIILFRYKNFIGVIRVVSKK